MEEIYHHAKAVCGLGNRVKRFVRTFGESTESIDRTVVSRCRPKHLVRLSGESRAIRDPRLLVGIEVRMDSPDSC